MEKGIPFKHTTLTKKYFVVIVGNEKRHTMQTHNIIIIIFLVTQGVQASLHALRLIPESIEYSVSSVNK